VREIEALIAPGSVERLDFEAVEDALRREALRWTAQLVEARFNADLSDEQGPHLACSCGGCARYVGRREKTFQTLLGPLRLERAYYLCPDCRRGWAPRDQALGLVGSRLSPGLMRMVGTVGSMVSFEEGSKLLDDLAGVQVPPKQVERTSKTLGHEIAQDERQATEPDPLVEPLPGTLYVGLDGTGVPMRPAELHDRRGKQPDGSAKTREVKLCAIWSAESRDNNDRPMRDPGSVSYTGAIESAATSDTDKQLSAFAQRVEREALRRSFYQAPRQVVLGDGAAWIWNVADELFPQAIQIVDRFHAKDYLSRVGKDIYGPTSELATAWIKARYGELDTGQIDSIVTALKIHQTHSEAARTAIEYFNNHRQRMAYPTFEAQGLCTSTGVLEAGCKITVGARLKQAGMHWSLQGANAIIALRCNRLSGRFEDFWQRRAQRGLAS
jgi:hypothetical protein